MVVYLLLAGCLFAELGYRQVWLRLVSGLEGLPLPDPTEAALTKARRRLGPAPLRALFDLLRGPAVTRAGPVRWNGLLVCAIDGTIISVPDSPANLSRFVRLPAHSSQVGVGGCQSKTGASARTRIEAGSRPVRRAVIRLAHGGAW